MVSSRDISNQLIFSPNHLSTIDQLGSLQPPQPSNRKEPISEPVPRCAWYLGFWFILLLGCRDGHIPSAAGLPSSPLFCKSPKGGRSWTAALSIERFHVTSQISWEIWIAMLVFHGIIPFPSWRQVLSAIMQTISILA